MFRRAGKCRSTLPTPSIHWSVPEERVHKTFAYSRWPTQVLRQLPPVEVTAADLRSHNLEMYFQEAPCGIGLKFPNSMRSFPIETRYPSQDRATDPRDLP